MRDLVLGERIAVNLSHLGHAPACLGLVTSTSLSEENHAVIFLANSTLNIQLLEPQRRKAYESLSPGQWCCIESFHRSLF